MLQDEMSRLAPVDPWHVVRGHDLIEILRLGLRNVLGNLKPTVGADGIAGLMRQAMSPQDLRATGLWRDMRDWQDANRPYLVLG